jgi:hypothetical protein
MASQWSRLRGELYLGKEWWLRGVEDACGLMVVLWVSLGVRWHGAVETTGKIKMTRVREGERGWPGLHSERARDVESLARHACHTVAILCAWSAMTFTERCLKHD